MTSLSPIVSRPRVASVLRAGGPLVVVAAPAGFGKSVALDELGPGLVRVAVGATEGHGGLLADAMAQRLKKVFPKALGAVRALAALRTGEPPTAVIARVLAELPAGAELTLAFDEVDELPAGSEALAIVQALVREPPAGLRLVLSGRPPLGALGQLAPLGADVARLGVETLAFDEDEVGRVVAATLGAPDLALATRVRAETGGWPALVAARLATGAGDLTSEELAKAFAPTVEQVLRSLRGDVRFMAQVAAVAGRADRPFVQALASGDVPGGPEARRRLVRLEPAAVGRALDELERLALIVDVGALPTLHAAARLVLRERFRAADHAGFLETNRRTGELLLASAPVPSPEVVDLFSVAEERERVIDLLARHGTRLELELAARGDDARLLSWIERLEKAGIALPFWADLLGGVVGARRGDPASVEVARDRLDRARAALSQEKKEAVLWRWQPRIAEGQALAARAKGNFADARSWLSRGLDQLAQTRKRGIVGQADEREAAELELRMLFLLARLSRDAAGWEKTKEPLLQALAILDRRGPADGEDRRRVEARAMLLAGAAPAADAVILTQLASGGDPLAESAAAWGEVLADGRPAAALPRARAAWEAAADPVRRAVCGIMLARLGPPDEEAQALLADVVALGAGREATAAWVAEAEIRSGRRALDGAEAAPGEGWLGALQVELKALEGDGAKTPRALEAARDAWRRLGARWEEARVLLVLAAQAETRAEAGESEAREVMARALDGALEIAAQAGFALPWDLLGAATAAVLRAGYRYGSERARAACRVELEKRGTNPKTLVPDARAPKIPAPGSAGVGSAGQARRLAHSTGAAYVAAGRSTFQALTEAEYQALVESRGASSFVVVVPERIVLNYGKRISLGQKRIILPLLLAMLRHPEQAFSTLELARAVWDATELTPTIVTKVKVAVSRLRALLGRNRAYINTTRKDDHGESVVAYQVASQLNFLIVDHANAS